MRTVQLSKNVLVPNQGWQRVSLEEAEAMEVIGRVRMINTSLMKVCLEDANEIGKLSAANKVRVAVALFSKLGMHSFTAYKEELDEKVHMIRDEAKKAGQSTEQH